MSIEHAKLFDTKNGDALWQDVIAKEIYQVLVSLKIFQFGESTPLGWKKSTVHLIFDVKMEFTRKARWVKDGHRTPDPETSSYGGVASWERIHIALMTAAL